MNRKIYKHKDNVRCQLNAGISASAVTIPLKAGNGAQLPVTYTGSATSLGSSLLLNSTGIGSSGVGVGDIIENITDGSYAVILGVSTNSITTTRLKGGSDNTWQNADKWAVNRFIITLINYDADGVTVLKREKILIDSRSGDNLTVNVSGRGFDGSTAQSFSADDYAFLFLTAAAIDGFGQGFSQLIQDVDKLISQGSGEIYAADSGANDTYSITLVPNVSAYIVGQVFNFKANTPNTGAATLNVNSLGDVIIKKNHDYDLENNDIESGQIITVIYDGTYFQMQSQIANKPISSPVGSLIMWPTSTPPTGWLICDGSAISRTTYADLFAVLGTLYGEGDGSTTFNLPNFKNRTAIGADSSAKIVIDSCDAAWTAGSNVTATNDTGDKKEGTGSVKLAVAAGAIASQILGYKAVTSFSLVGKTMIGLWIKSSISLNSGDLKYQLDDTAALASPIESINIPAIAANTWTKIYLPLAVPGSDTAIISHGIYQVVDKGAFNLWIDDIAYGENYELGANGGEKTHKLSIAELAAHTHTETVSGGSQGITPIMPTGSTSSYYPTSLAIDSAGGDKEHNNLQPYMTINFIVKV